MAKMTAAEAAVRVMALEGIEQAVDIESISKPVTKWSVTVREPALVPRAFQQAFHLMRSGRPGPVLIDLPFDVQMCEIEFDPKAYRPLPVYQPRADREQIEQTLALLIQAHRPLIVAGGGIINADASPLLVQFAEITGVPVIPTLMGWGAIPDNHALMAAWSGCKRSIAMAMRPCSLPISYWASAIAGPTDTPVRSRCTPRVASLSMWISSQPRSGAYSAPIWVSCPTPERHSSFSSRSHRRGSRRASFRTGVSGCVSARSASVRITNIAMGTEINAVNEFEEIVDLEPEINLETDTEFA